jgi:Fe-S oxidoreductase/diadenosine tetraphosphate (Ap4A) HIT family hydrolase
MGIARALGGVISGEHGIGMTKLEFLTEEETREFRAYKQRIDPEGRFNKGKLLPGATLESAWTPSFGLMGHESLIMQQSDIKSVSDAIKDCLRCGKCKPVCATHVPRANLLYSPRNKILATSLLIEAFLYEEQTRRGVSIRHWDEFDDVAGHCTVCHKCVTPCPVDIDFGDVTMAMRDLLRRMGKKRFNPGSAASMFFLNATRPETIKLARKLMIDWGYKAQRLGNRLFALAARAQTRQPPATTGKAPLKAQVIHFVNKKMPAGLPAKTARALLDIEDSRYLPIIRNPATTPADAEAVFYFPGCGSERLFSQVGLATQAMLWHVGVQTVLPPGYLCCGYPQRGSGQFDKAEKIITDNRVLFHRVANTLNYLDIRTVVVSWHLLRPVGRLQIRGDLSRLQDRRHPRVPAGKGREARCRARRPLHVPRSLPQPDEAAGAAEDRQCADRHRRRHADREERPLLRRIRHAGGQSPRRVDPGALPQGAGNAQGRRKASRRRLHGRGQGADLVPVVPAGPEALQRRCRCRRRLHRRRAGEAPARRELDAEVRGGGQRRRHRARARMTVPCPFCAGDGGEVLFRDDLLRVVLVDDRDYPGFVRVITNAHRREMTDLPPDQRQRVLAAVFAVETAQREVLAPHKVNLASLGNQVPHLHWHVVPRFDDDAHFPEPVWGTRQREPDAAALAGRRARLPALRAAIVARFSAGR